jgi:hypothetical protein
MSVSLRQGKKWVIPLSARAQQITTNYVELTFPHEGKEHTFLLHPHTARSIFYALRDAGMEETKSHGAGKAEARAS